MIEPEAGRPARVRRASGAAWRLSVRVLAGLLLTVLGLAIVGWVALHFAILPHIERWRPQIEQRASAALGVAVRIGHIDVRSSGLVPALDLQDVVLLDVLQREALRLPRVSASLSARSLLSLQLRFSQLLIEGAALDLRRDAKDRLFVAGLELGASHGGAGDTSAVDWFFKQREFAIRNGSITWTDERRDAPALSLTDVDVVVRNGLFSHDIRIDATPPPDWGDRFSLRGRFTQRLLERSGDWEHWSGEAYVDLPRADVKQLRNRITLPFDLQEGVGALRAWIDLRQGVARRATVDLALRTVALRLKAGPGAEPLAPLAFEELEGRFVGLYDKDRSSVTVQQFGFVTDDLQRWPRSDMSLAWDGPTDAPAKGGVFTAQRLDLALMAQIADGLPLGDGLRRHLSELAPRGVVSGLSVNWTGPADAPERYQVKASIADLALQPGAIPPPPAAFPLSHELGRPGFRNMALQLTATERGGEADVSMLDGALDLPGVFDEPQVPMDRLTTRVNWRFDPAGASDPNRQLRVQLHNLRFANADADGEADATWRVGLGPAVLRAGAATSASSASSQPSSSATSTTPATVTAATAARNMAASAAAAAARLVNPASGNAPTSRLGVLELSGKIAHGKANRVFRYLPAELPVATRHYVDRAVKGGALDSVAFSVKGDLADFPFHKPKNGEFKVDVRARDVDFDYAPAELVSGAAPTTAGTPSPMWPAITGLAGQMIIDRTSMELRNLQGRVYGVELGNVNGAIADLSESPALALNGVVRGPAADFLRFIRVSPIGDWTARSLDEAVIGGNTELTVAMHLPLDDMSRTTVKGSVNLGGNDVRFGPSIPALTGARGRVDFSEHGFAVVGGAARVLGGDATFDGGSQPDGSLRFNGQGTASADALRRASELGFVSRLAASLNGQAPYRLALGFAKGQTEMDISSSLVGIESTLPSPLNKAMATILPLHYQTSLQTDSIVNGTATRDTMKVDVGNLVKAVYQRELRGTAAPRVLRGSVGVMDAAVLPESGVTALVRLASLDVAAWQKVVDRLAAEGATPTPVASSAASAASTAAGTTPNTSAGSNGGGDDYIPDSIGLVVTQLDVNSRKLSHVVAGLSRRNDIWRANLDADQLNGYAEYRPPGRTRDGGVNLAENSAGLVYARLARLALPESEVTSVENLLDQQPISMPALDIVVDDFELRGMRLGRIDIEASNRSEGRGEGGRNAADPATREWTLSRLDISSPDGQLSATGKWEPAPHGAEYAEGRRRTLLDFKLDLANGGAFLDRLGFEQVVRGAKGSLSGQIAWAGSPLSIDYPSMSGAVNIALQQGQFLKVNPGAARLLGVLSLQAIPRRLTLDFRDLFQQGFAFDSVIGDVKVARGVATTNNLRMRGVQAAVLMAGSADLNAETADLRVVVVPEINAGTASLAYAVINPAIGLGTFLAQMFLKQPLTRAGTREFHISGSWEDPKIDKVARRLGDPIPDFGADEPAASASEAASGPTSGSGGSPR